MGSCANHIDDPLPPALPVVPVAAVALGGRDGRLRRAVQQLPQELSGRFINNSHRHDLLRDSTSVIPGLRSKTRNPGATRTALYDPLGSGFALRAPRNDGVYIDVAPISAFVGMRCPGNIFSHSPPLRLAVAPSWMI